MSGVEGHDDLDLEMDERLRQFARASRTPTLPDEVEDLPWTVQLDRPRSRSFTAPGSWFGGFQGVLAGVARLGVTLAVAGGFLVLVSSVRPGESSAADFIGGGVQPTATPMSGGAPGSAGEVVLVPTTGVVDQVMADHVTGAIHRAENDNAAAVVIELDTLGGSLDAMQRITEGLNSTVPTIVWVAPSGGTAASAGTFITLSANLAYMAPGTSIGAASPVAANGQDISQAYGQTEADKTMQFAIAMISGLAEKNHPDAVNWAVTTVQDARAYTANQALQAKAINGIAATLDDVLNQADGVTVTTKNGPATLHTKGATILTIEEDPIQSVLHALDDPNIAFILLVVGVLLIAIEFFHPTILMALLGAMCLALSFYGSGSLPLNILGVVLVVLGIGMLILETFVPSYGLLTIGGVASFVVGSIAFYGSPGPYLPATSVAWPVVGVMVAFALGYAFVIVRVVMQMRREELPAGSGLVGTIDAVGSIGKVQSDLAPLGTVYAARESWTAKTADGEELPKGTSVRVVRQEGLTLIVEKVDG
jgi:membrane-bound serine protease (ClpP class)